MITPISTYSNNIYNQNNNPAHKGGIKSLNKFNPIANYMNDYFIRMAKASNTKIQPIIPSLEKAVNIVNIKSGKQNLVAWDINPKKSDKYILFLHGMAQNISDYQNLYEAILNQGDFGVLALEYRAYGENLKGKPTEDNLINDSKNGLKYLLDKKNIPPQNIVIAGHSMGGSIATSVASKQKNLKALLLICPLTKTDYLGKKFSESSTLGMGIPQKIQILTEKIKPLKWLYGLFFNSIDKVKKVTCPIFLIHSRNDTVTTLKGARNFVKTAHRNNVQIEYHYPALGGHKVDKRKIDIFTKILDELK